MASPEAYGSITSYGLVWVVTVEKAMASRVDPTSLVCRVHAQEPGELASYLNFLRWVRRDVSVNKNDGEILTQGLFRYVQGRLKADPNIDRAFTHLPPTTHAPRSPHDPHMARGIEYHSSTHLVKVKCIFPSSKLVPLPTKDVWGNNIGTQFTPKAQPVKYTEPEVETIVANLTKCRDAIFKWAKNLGWATESLNQLQDARADCEIWGSRTSHYSALNIHEDLIIALEQIDALQWEILTVMRIIPEQELPSQWKGQEHATVWFNPMGGHMNIIVPVVNKDDRTPLADPGVIEYATGWRADDARADDCFRAACIKYSDAETMSRLKYVENMDEEPVDRWAPPPVTPPENVVVDDGGQLAYLPRGSPMVQALQAEDDFSQFERVAPIHAIRSGVSAITTTPRAVQIASAAVPWGGSDSDDDEGDESPRRATRSLFSAKDLQGRIPKVNLQKGEAADLFRFGQAVQRYAENKNCNASILLDTVIAQGSPNDRNLQWLREHFARGFAERKCFFQVFRRKVLPSFGLDKLSECAIAYPFMDYSKYTAKEIGSDYLDYMKPYLYLAQTPQDREGAELLMQKRFYKFLGTQLRQGFEAVCAQKNVKASALPLTDMVDALKAYENKTGFEAHANPDPDKDHTLLSYNIRDPELDRTKQKPLLLRYADKTESKLTRDIAKRAKEAADAYERSDDDEKSEPRTQNGRNKDRNGNKNRNRRDRQGNLTHQVAALGEQMEGMKAMLAQNAAASAEAKPVAAFGQGNRNQKDKKKPAAQIPFDYSKQKKGKGYKKEANSRQNTEAPQEGAVPPPGSRYVGKNYDPDYAKKRKAALAALEAAEKGNGDQGGGTRGLKPLPNYPPSAAAAIKSQANGPLRCFACGREGHFANNCELHRKLHDPSFDNRRACYRCNRTGHWAADCKEGASGNQ